MTAEYRNLLSRQWCDSDVDSLDWSEQKADFGEEDLFDEYYVASEPIGPTGLVLADGHGVLLREDLI